MTAFLKQDFGFEQHPNDSCLLKRESQNGRVFIVIYVDDCFILGNEKEVLKTLNEIERGFDITRSSDIEDFIACSIARNNDSIYLSQPDLIMKLLKKFEGEIKHLKNYDTPAQTSFESFGTKINKRFTDPVLDRCSIR